MLGGLRWSIYRNAMAFLMWVSFRQQPVYPVVTPEDGTVEFEPYAAAFPGLALPGVWHARTFPEWEHAPPRLRRIAWTRVAVGLLRRLVPSTTGPIPTDHSSFLDVVYPTYFRRAWPDAPRVLDPVAAALAGPDGDVVAELAVRGSHAWALRAVRTTDGTPVAGRYEVDTSWLQAYQPLPGLLRPGGRAVLEVTDGRLRTVAVEAVDAGAGPGDPDGGVDPTLATRLLLAGWNEDHTTIRHNLFTHLTVLTSFALATTNLLSAAHPVRRLLHPCFQTLLIGNHEIATFQLSGPTAFAPRIFSHDAVQIVAMARDRLGAFDVWDLEPDTQFARRGTTSTPFDYPYRDNVLTLWRPTLELAREYLAVYYPDEAALGADAAVAGWLAELDRLLPGGVSMPDGGPSRDWLARLCALLVHLSSVEHDYQNNVAWNYGTLGWLVPAVVPASREPMDRRRSFDLIATYLGTWKRYNMLLTCGWPDLALDDLGRAVIRRWLDRMEAIQAHLATRGPEPWLSYPINLNPSVSD